MLKILTDAISSRRARRPFAVSRALAWLAPAALAFLFVFSAVFPESARAFGEEGAFNPRVLLTGNARWEGVRATAPARWAKELADRTSAPARLSPTTVRADEPALLAEPFALWGGDGDIPPLTEREVGGLKRDRKSVV